MAKASKVLTWCALTLIALMAVMALVVALFDWNLAKPWITRQLSAALARDIRVDGPITLGWSLARKDETGSVNWLPQLHFTARGLKIGNPDWARSTGHLLRARTLDLHFPPLPLLHWHWHITDLRVDGLDLAMERVDERRKNWRFSDQPRSRWSFDIHQIVFERAQIRYVDQPLDLDLHFDVRPLVSPTNQAAQVREKQAPASVGPASPEALVLQAAVSGRLGQAHIEGKLRGGALPDLLNENSIYPLQAEGDVGGVHTVLAGNLVNPHHLTRAELQIGLNGDSLDRLYAASGVPLPATRAFSTQGQLTISRVDTETRAWNWHYAHFTGKVGDSDFAGDAQYYRGPPKNRLNVKAQAELLRLSDYVPAAGKDAADGHGRARTRVLPEDSAQPERWAKLDAEFGLYAKRVELHPDIQLQDATTTLRLQDQVLTAAPLHFALAGGKGEGEISLDGRQTDIRARLQLQLQAVQVRQLFPRLSRFDATFGKVDGQATLSGSGNSVAGMLAGANGEIKATLSEGTISQFILEAAGLNLANAVFAKLYRDQQVKLLCGAADVSIKDGLAQVRHGILNTEDAAIDVSGQVDLGKESLALNVVPRTKQVRILSLRTPLYVSGTFAKPDIGANKEGLAARAGAAAALALVAPVAAVIPLITPGQKIPDDCAAHGAAAPS
ncbi:AsmA family protein [Herbaspirillum sp. DW155]|uniref:AsmA family protein n=1 Tax=Herbaspirillum sp. DW155 TaxID=3095609 RepID=UPI003092F82E|nr:AsmA family protein [Herbaspirillum sp. DW155]